MSQTDKPHITVIRMGETPRSLNKLGARGSWRAIHHEKKRLQKTLEGWLMVARLPRPLPGFLVVEATLRFPTRHRRDAGNYQAPLEKALGDALVNGRWLTDDTPVFWDFRKLEFDKEVGSNMTTIKLIYGVNP